MIERLVLLGKWSLTKSLSKVNNAQNVGQSDPIPGAAFKNSLRAIRFINDMKKILELL